MSARHASSERASLFGSCNFLGAENRGGDHSIFGIRLKRGILQAMCSTIEQTLDALVLRENPIGGFPSML